MPPACTRALARSRKVSRGLPSADVIIATSSLSELDMDAFFWYFNNVLPRTNYLLYAYSKVPMILERGS